MTDPDPEPGDFDDELLSIDAQDVEIVASSEDRRLVVQVTLAGDDAERLARIARSEGRPAGVVVRSLIRDASDAAA